MGIQKSPLATAGILAGNPINFTNPFVDGTCGYRPGSSYINGSKSRDPGNTDDVTVLRPGLLMAHNLSTKYYAPFSIGVLQSGATSAGTTLSLTTAAGTELARRVGSTGTVVVTGPPTAAGVVRQVTATYSAVSGGTVTITAMGVNSVQTVNLSTAATGGSIRLLVPKTDGTLALTPAAAWSATDATLLSNLNTALDTATGVVGGIVATAIAATDTDLGFVLTFSGTGYAGMPWPLVVVDTLYTSNTGANVVRTTAGVDGRFVAGSFVSESGYHTPSTLIKEPVYPIPAAGGNVDYPRVPMVGYLDVAQIVDYPSDASLKTWVKQSMSTTTGNKFMFNDEV